MDETTFSARLERWLQSDSPKSIGGVGEIFAQKTFAVLIFLLMITPALPLPTGGVTHVFEVIAILIAGQMVLGFETLWLPQRWKNRELGNVTLTKTLPKAVGLIRWLEKYSRPRMASLYSHRWLLQLLGIFLIGFSVAAALAPPFTGLDTLPALGAVLIALSIILEDALFLLLGTGIGVAGVLLSVFVGSAVVDLVRHLF